MSTRKGQAGESELPERRYQEIAERSMASPVEETSFKS